MLSRIADSMFWLSRYMERSDGLLRTVRTHYILMLDKGVNAHLSWQPVLKIFTSADEATIAALKDNSEASLDYLLLDSSNINSLKILFAKARENARGVQDHITKEVWEHVNFMYHSINNLASEHFNHTSVIEAIDLLANSCILYNGVADTTMPRGLSWNFMNLGRYIERCLLTIELSDKYFSMIDYNMEEEKDILQWRPLLLSLSGYELHLKTYRTSTHNSNTLHQVLFNENFSRSVLYNLVRIERYFSKITKQEPSEKNDALSKMLGRLISKIKYTDFTSLNQKTLPSYLTDTRKELAGFSKQLAEQFFSYY